MHEGPRASSPDSTPEETRCKKLMRYEKWHVYPAVRISRPFDVSNGRWKFSFFRAFMGTKKPCMTQWLGLWLVDGSDLNEILGLFVSLCVVWNFNIYFLLLKRKMYSFPMLNSKLVEISTIQLSGLTFSPNWQIIGPFESFWVLFRIHIKLLDKCIMKGWLETLWIWISNQLVIG